MDRPVASLYPDWPQYASRIRDAVAGLAEDQLALRPGPDHAPIWALAAHIAGTRVYWLSGVFREPGADRTPWPAPLDDPGWEDDLAHPRTGDELARALDSSWEVVRVCLERWTLPDLDRTALRVRADGVRQRHSRASVLNRLFTHDAFHAGEISQILGRHDLPAIDLWVRSAAPFAPPELDLATLDAGPQHSCVRLRRGEGGLPPPAPDVHATFTSER